MDVERSYASADHIWEMTTLRSAIIHCVPSVIRKFLYFVILVMSSQYLIFYSSYSSYIHLSPRVE